MKLMVLGAGGLVGARVLAMARELPGWTAVGASASGRAGLRVDVRDAAALAQALRGMDAVVHCVAGSADVIERGAQVLATASTQAGCGRLVHLSSMAVYGDLQGLVPEWVEPGPALGWYDRAKRAAELALRSHARAGGRTVVLRPGCIWGPGSRPWVSRLAHWLRAGRLGDLGAAGDGWSNLVHVDDVAVAALRALQLNLPEGALRTWNLAAPDSPRWNEVFTDLALGIGATPLRRLRHQPWLDAHVAGPVLQVLRLLARRAGLPADRLPEPLTPGLLALWRRQLQLDVSAASRDLLLDWTDYPVALESSVAWLLASEECAPGQAAGDHVRPA